MYGRIGSLIAAPGQRDELARVILDGMRDMPGCLSYVVAADASDSDTLWITEAWTDRAALQRPAVQKAMRLGRPLIQGMGDTTETEPIGGLGYEHCCLLGPVGAASSVGDPAPNPATKLVVGQPWPSSLSYSCPFPNLQLTRHDSARINPDVYPPSATSAGTISLIPCKPSSSA